MKCGWLVSLEYCKEMSIRKSEKVTKDHASTWRTCPSILHGELFEDVKSLSFDLPQDVMS